MNVPFNGFYQAAYVTTDFERAKPLFAETHGIKSFYEIPDLQFPTGSGRQGRIRVGFAYAGALEVELIQPLDGDVGIYLDFLPKEGFGIRFHHLCELFETPEDLDRQYEAYRKLGKSFPIVGELPGMAKYYYCDFCADLGHYIEGAFFEKEARAAKGMFPKF